MPDASSLMLAQEHKLVPLELRDVAVTDALGRLQLLGRSLRLMVGDEVVELITTKPPAEAEEAPWVALTINGFQCAVQTSWGALRRRSGLPVEASAPEEAALIVEDAFSDWLEAFEKTSGAAIRLNFVGLAVVNLPIVIGVMTGGVPVRVALDQAAADALLPFLSTQVLTVPDSLVLSVSLEVEEVALGLGALKTLNVGDALGLGPAPSTVRVCAQSSHFATAKKIDETLELQTAFRRQTYRDDMTMESDTSDIAAENLDDMDVRISIRAGEALITLGDLKQLGPGSVLPMLNGKGSEVDLVVNGRRIGTGSLVTMGAERAVEITELFGDG